MIDCNQSIGKIGDSFTFPTLENDLNQFSVVFDASEHCVVKQLLGIEVTEINFQTSEEKTLPIPKTSAVLAHHRTPFVCDPRKAHRTGFQPGQVVQDTQDKATLSVGATDGRNNRFG